MTEANASSPEPAKAPSDTVQIQPPPTMPAVQTEESPSPKAIKRMSPERLAAEIGRLDRLLVVALLVLAFLLGSFTARNSDFWMHLATGRALAQGSYHFGTDPFAYTTAGTYWANHSWLGDWLLYVFTLAMGGIDRPITGSVLVAVKAALVVLLGGLLLAIRRRDLSIWVPVVCVGLALLVMSPRLHLQPTIISLLFMGATLYLLAREGKRTRTAETSRLGVLRTSAPARLYALPLLFLLWVNLDSWFLLGPLLVALAVIGDFLQEKLAPLRTAGDAPQPGEPRAQLQALGLGLAACLVNPHTYHAFVLPPDLFAILQPVGLRQDPWFHTLFVSPWSKDYFTAAVGYNPAGLAYFGLAGLGIASFGVNSAGTRGGRTVIWLVFCLLSAANQRFIPFFAVVAGPITALNFQDYLADRYGTALPDRDVSRSWALAGRALTLLLLGLLIAGAWPGLLHANANSPRFARRVAWNIEIEPSLRQAAEQLAAWRQSEQLTGMSRGFATSAEMANYCAWFAHSEKGFFDHRYPLFEDSTNDYVELRRWLEGRGEKPNQAANLPRQDPKWLRILREKRIDHVILTGSQCNDTVAQMLQFPREWTLIYLDGRTTIFGWDDPDRRAKTGSFEKLKLDLSVRAFGPNPDRAPVEGMSRSPRVAGEWDRYWQAPPPFTLDADEAFMDVLYFEATKQHWQNARVSAAIYAGFASCVSAGSSGTGPAAVGAPLALFERLENAWFPFDTVNQRSPRSHGGRLMSMDLRSKDEGPPAAPLVALRAARRAVAANPDDPTAHLGVAHATFYLWTAQENHWTGTPSPGQIVPAQLRQLRELIKQQSPALGAYLSRWITRSVNRRQLLRQVQVVTALQYALLLNPEARGAHDLLSKVYWHMGYYDLALEHLRGAFDQAKAAAPAEATGRKKEYDLRLARQERFLKEVEKEVAELQNEYELHALKLPPPQRRLLAFAPFGLAKLALTSLEQADMTQFSPPEANLYVYLLVTMGQTSKITDETGKPGVLPDLPNLKKALGREYHWNQAVLATAVGDAARASKSLEEAQPPPFKPSRPPLADVLQAMTFGPLQPFPLCRLTVTPLLQQQFVSAEAALARQQGQSNFQVLRGLVALDEGDVDAARRYFRAALQSADLTPAFESRPIALRYLDLMEGRKSTRP